jgi:catechol-2,3-dioxygenase
MSTPSRSMFSHGLAEIVLIVKDVRAAAQFYQDVVGLTSVSEADDAWAWFWAGDPDQTQSVGLHKGSLLFEDQSPLPEGERWGHVHYAFKVPTERLADAVGHVRGKGVEVFGPVHFDWMNATSYYFYDLDGNLLEFWSPHSG